MYDIFAQILAEKKLKASDVSKGTGIAPPVFSEWKKGKSSPKTDKLQKIADFLGVTIEYLISGENNISHGAILPREDENDISRRIEQTLKDLEDLQQALVLDGKPMDTETREILAAGLENSIRVAKINAKKRLAAYANIDTKQQ